MNGFPMRASQTPRPAPGSATALDLPTAVKMLPLIRRIAVDLAANHARLVEAKAEQVKLDTVRRALDWPARQRRYQLQEERVGFERRRKELGSELKGLGVAVVDAAHGRVGFPTIVNGKDALFTWQPGEETVAFWQFPGEERRRTVPPEWLKVTPPRPAGRRKGK